MKNDVYQQIYKMREFQEKLYVKDIEIDARIDQEALKARTRDD